jgi:hypothetical protein
MKRIGRTLLLTVGVIGLTLVLGALTSREVRAAVSALVTVSNTSANPVITESMEVKNAFQAQLTVGPTLTPQALTIPVGQRLMVDFVTISGVAFSAGGPIQPVIILQSSLNGGGSANYYIEPGPSPISIPGANQLYLAQPMKVYADSLTVSPGYAGYAPSTYVFNVAISGHTVAVP